MESSVIHIAVVDDDRTVREGLKMLINGTHGYCCEASYEDGKTALDEIPVLNPDVVLMDINLPDISGIECIMKIKEIQPQIQFIMLTVFENEEMIFRSLAAGANGYLLKQTPPGRLLEAIGEVHRGGSPMSSEIARRVVQSFQHSPLTSGTSNGLTKREEEILALLCRGYLYKEIAERSGISIDTVRSHIRHIYEKLQVKTRTEAILKHLNL